MKRAALALGAVALLLAGCGGSSSPSHASSGPSSTVGQLLLQGFVATDAYTSWLYGGASADLASARTSIAQLRAALLAVDGAMRKQRVPSSAQNQYAAYLSASGSLIARLGELGGVSSQTALRSALTTSLSPAITAYEKAERPLRVALGISAFAWLKARPLGATVYSDSLASAQGSGKWLLGSNVHYGEGGLVVSTVKENGLTGPSSSHSFDGRHLAVQVDARVLSGKPYVGILCPGVVSTPNEFLSGQVGPGAEYSFGIFRTNAASALLRGPSATRLVNPGTVNRIRVDCDQFAPGFTTIRLYVNGTFVDYASAPVSITSYQEPGVLVVRSTATPASAVFTNWSVSKLAQ